LKDASLAAFFTKVTPTLRSGRENLTTVSEYIITQKGTEASEGSLKEVPMDQRNVTFYRWEDMPKERVSDVLDRRLITGDRVMLTHVYLKKGAVVPRHSHHNEQITYILEGGLRFWIGEDESQVIDVLAGEVLHIPSLVPHKAEALADTVDVDVFSPPRQDWLDKTDDYLRQT
jgi:quercetin dioxygenase-like cupin family protein